MRPAAIAGLLLVSLLVLVGGAALAVGGYQVRGPSMAPTLVDGEVVLANPLDRSPERFETVVFTPSVGNASVKRVIGLPGDRLRIRTLPTGPQVEVQPGGTGTWQRVRGPDVAWPGAEACCDPDGRASAGPTDVLVPADSYFLLGDNRPVSIDSRREGFVPATALRGTLALGLVPLGATVGTAGFALEPVPSP